MFMLVVFKFGKTIIYIIYIHIFVPLRLSKTVKPARFAFHQFCSWLVAFATLRHEKLHSALCAAEICPSRHSFSGHWKWDLAGVVKLVMVGTVGKALTVNQPQISPEIGGIIGIWMYDIALHTTVDGRNPAPVDRLFIPLFIGFQPFKVVQDFFHPL